MAMTRDTTWRYVLVVVAVAFSLAAWLCTVFGVYSTVNMTFESYLNRQRLGSPPSGRGAAIYLAAWAGA